MNLIAYPAQSGVITVGIAPGLSPNDVAASVVPSGTPFAILDEADLPDLGSRVRWVWANGAIQVGPEVVTQTTQITFAQLLIGLVAEGWITEAEGDAWLAGTPPAPVIALIGQLPQAQRFAAKARAIRPSIVLRSDPLVIALGTMQGKTPAQLDAFFNTYGAA